jgi:propionate CoA-transferase
MNNETSASFAVTDVKSRLKQGKVVTAHEAVQIIRDGDTIAMDGFIGMCAPEEILVELENIFLETGSPKNLSIIIPSTSGDGKDKGLNRLAHTGLLKRVTAGHFGMIPKVGKLAVDGTIEAYNFPQGVLAGMYVDIASGRPRTISKVGLGSFVDPRIEGGKIGPATKDDLVEVITFDGEEYLAYKHQPLNVAILRGTTADIDGNITMEKEALVLEVLYAAMAVKNQGGLVIVQVERIADRHTLNPRDVKIPGILVDCVVVSKPENHFQTSTTFYNPAYSCEFRVPAASITPLILSDRKVIARRAAFELRPNMIVNLGIGMPEGVASVANEEGILDYITLTAEAGTIGGIPAGGLDFGAAVNADCLYGMNSQFDFYDGGGLHLACLGSAQVDETGNVNVSRFGPKLAGCGGFIDISQNTKKIIFTGLFTAGAEIEVKNGKLKIIQEGKTKKFVKSVEQITFSSLTALRNKNDVLFITERCVFSLTGEGLELIEVAPGIDIEKDILANMDFKPIIKNPQLMDERIFNDALMDLNDELLSIPIPERFSYDSNNNILYVNFARLNIRTKKEVDLIKTSLESLFASIGKKVNAVVNYDKFSIAPELESYYIGTVENIVKSYYEKVTRYTSSVFLRMMIEYELEKRGFKNSVYKTLDEAKEALIKERE